MDETLRVLSTHRDTRTLHGPLQTDSNTHSNKLTITIQTNFITLVAHKAAPAALVVSAAAVSAVTISAAAAVETVLAAV
jgi:hypothetical protein